MTRVDAGQDDLKALIRRLTAQRDRIVIHEGNRDVAALISMEDLALLEELEERLDALEARQAESEAAIRGEDPVDWEQAKKDLGL